MGLRSKFLLILIIFSVVPLLSFFFINQRLFDKLGSEVYQIAKVLLLQTTAKELQASADNYTLNINREMSYIVKHLENCRDEIEKAMFQSKLTSSQNSALRAQEIATQKLPYFFQRLKIFRSELVSLNLSSGDGFHLQYPPEEDSGTALIPYLENTAPGEDKPVWGLPGMFPSGDLAKQYITVGLPIQYANGSTMGNISIVFDIIKLLQSIRPSSQWSPYMKSLLLVVDYQKDNQIDGFQVIGTRAPLSDNTVWLAEKTFSLNRVLEVEDAAVSLFLGKKYGEQGYVSLPYEGEVSVLAFSKIEIGLGILNILPEREVLYRITRHPGRLSRWLSLDSFLIVSGVVMIMVIIAVYRSRLMLVPFFSMVSAFRRLSEGDFSSRLEFSTQDERQMVADAFNDMTLQLKDGMRMRQGLEVAKEVQHNFFPEVATNISDLEIAAGMSYCEETGGDYVDVLQGKDGKICVIVGDVTGHGIGAALLMATIRSLIRGRYEIDSDLSQLITSVNHKLTVDMGESGRFVTLFILEIDPAVQKMRWVRAGHDPAWFFCNRDNSIVSLIGPGLALGVDSEFVYSGSCRDNLESGDVIVIGTDGIWETIDTDGHQFGKSRLEQIVSENLNRTATDISDSLLAAVSIFRGDQDQEDDVSLVVIKVAEQWNK